MSLVIESLVHHTSSNKEREQNYKGIGENNFAFKKIPQKPIFPWEAERIINTWAKAALDSYG